MYSSSRTGRKNHGIEDHTDALIPCTFAQRQCYITITRSDGVTHDLSPVNDGSDHFTDQDGRQVYRQAGLGDQGQIFRFPVEGVYVYWNTRCSGYRNETDQPVRGNAVLIRRHGLRQRSSVLYQG